MMMVRTHALTRGRSGRHRFGGRVARGPKDFTHARQAASGDCISAVSHSGHVHAGRAQLRKSGWLVTASAGPWSLPQMFDSPRRAPDSGCLLPAHRCPAPPAPQQVSKEHGHGRSCTGKVGCQPGTIVPALMRRAHLLFTCSEKQTAGGHARTWTHDSAARGAPK
jgi:hypothetical protein